MKKEPETEQAAEQIYHVTKKNYLMLVILMLLITVPVIPVLLYKYGIENTSRVVNTVTFEVDQGAGVSEIAEDLAKAGVIDSPLLFKVYIKLNGLEKNIQAGTYEIPPNVSIVDVVRMLQKGRDDVALTFIEGWTMEEFAILAAENLERVDYNEFINSANIDTIVGEGYLFPDTYFFTKDTNTMELLEKLHLTFDEKTQDFLTDKKLKKADLTKKEAIIFASIVEREVSDEKDRPIVAGILITRWRNGERLDADATTQYAVAHKDIAAGVTLSLEEAAKHDWWPKELTLEDLQYDSLYNTRKNAGLPPTPISSFSLSALDAVLNYETTNYSYYLTDNDGVTHYAKTLGEHENNVAKYL